MKEKRSLAGKKVWDVTLLFLSLSVSPICFLLADVQYAAKAGVLHGKENKVNGQECIFAHQKTINCYKTLGSPAFLIQLFDDQSTK